MDDRAYTGTGNCTLRTVQLKDTYYSDRRKGVLATAKDTPLYLHRLGPTSAAWGTGNPHSKDRVYPTPKDALAALAFVMVCNDPVNIPDLASVRVIATKTDRAPVVCHEPFNKLSPAEAERLACLLEEAGEVQQAIGKILRHGYGRRNPDAPMAKTNREVLNDELTDLMWAILRMQKAADISPAITENYWERLLGDGWMHHQD